ncbi:MAG: carbon-nitrogen hydrolase family protein [Candidatus Binatia bacterium]
MPLAAAIQMSAGPDKGANLEKAERLIREAVRRGAELVVLPEVFSWRGSRREEAESGAGEPVPGMTSELLSSLARELRIHLQSGSILERIEGERRCYNTALLFSPDGAIRGQYRKIHLFDVQIPGQVDARESEIRKPGDRAVVVETPLGRVGLSVCYDLRFPELYRELSRSGAEILCIPSAFTFPTGAAHWEPLIRARAIENQAFVIAPNQYGPSPHGHRDYGNSMIVDPWGTVVTRAGDAETVITAELDLGYLAKVRKELPCLRHRRLEP